MPRLKSQISRTPANKDIPQHKEVLFVEGIPETTKQAFKAACAMRKMTMRDAIITLMRGYIDQTQR